MNDTPKIYLETTMFNFYLDDDRGVMHAATRKLFDEIAEGRFEAYTSYAVVAELKKASDEKAQKMLGLIEAYGIPTLPFSRDALRLARIYLSLGIIPAKKRDDAIHIALTAVNGIDIIVSLNFKHIVRSKTIEQTSIVNAQNGHRAIQISSPMEVINDED